VTFIGFFFFFFFRAAQSGSKIPLTDVHLHAPITNPGKVLCVGLNYRCHCEEQHIDPPHEPMFFSKFADCIVGPTDNVTLPAISTVSLSLPIN